MARKKKYDLGALDDAASVILDDHIAASLYMSAIEVLQRYAELPPPTSPGHDKERSSLAHISCAIAELTGLEILVVCDIINLTWETYKKIGELPPMPFRGQVGES